MAPVIALDLPAGPAFVAALQRVWEMGGAAFPLDQRLPDAERTRAMSTIAPTHLLDRDGELRALDRGRPAEDGDALVMATSGTTGEPKGVVLTHDGVAASAAATSRAIGADPSSDTWLACLPPAHIGGLSVITRALHTGTRLIAHPGFDPQAVIDAAATGATLVSLVTRALVEIDPALFRVVVIGGAAPPADRPANVLATYGMTETGSGIVYERRPIDSVEIRIADHDEIEVRGPMLLRCYRDAEQDHDPFGPHGWFRTGDLGEITDDGTLRVFGRSGDVVVTGGEKVWPERTERVLRTLGGIADVAVTGRPHPDWGSELVAIVVPTDGAMIDLGELRAAVKAELPVWYAPRALVIVDALPRTGLGKIKRAALPEWIAHHPQ
jgi:O-succinylbenzoic acid--CoA ligase